VTFNEAQTRALHIDPQLRAGDWKLNDRTHASGWLFQNLFCDAALAVNSA